VSASPRAMPSPCREVLSQVPRAVPDYMAYS
jgi:hypothetical protein